MSNKVKLNLLAKAIAKATTAVCAGTILSTAALAQDEQAIEEVVVYGIKSSLINAQALKKDSTYIVDVISAEDIGKLPDENVAETLQRINGVQIQRRNGEGSRVSVRGLVQNRLSIDGVTLVSPIGRSFSGFDEGVFPVLQFVPSDLLSGAEVAKSSSADQVEGSLGGSVTLKLLKPLDVGDRISYSIKGSHDDRTGDTDPRLSVTLSKTFADDTLGLLLSYSQSKRSVGEELFFTRTGYSGVDTDDDGIDDSNFAPGDIRLQDLEEDRNRKGFLGSLQWRPSDNTEVYLTTFFASYDLARSRSWFSSGGSGGNDLANYTDPVVSASETIISGGFTSQIQGNGEDLSNDSETYSIILGGDHSVGSWDFAGKLTYGDAKQQDRQDFARIRQNDVGFFRDFSGPVPILNVVDGFNVLAPASYDSGSGLIGFSNDITYESDETTVEVEATYNFEDNKFITKVEGGFRWSDQKATRTQFRAGNATRGGGVWIVNTEGGLEGKVDAALYEQISLRKIYGGPSNQAAFLAANPHGLGGTRQLLAFVQANTPEGQGVFAPQVDGTYGTSEEISALFLKANFGSELGGIPISGNVGLRWVQTKQVSDFFQVTEPGGVFTATPTTFNRSYDNLLPSLNIRLDLKEDLLLRFAASKIFSRPSTSSLAGSLSLDEAGGTASGGNPALSPAKADAYDLSLEWYISNSSSLSVALFYKDVEGFLGSQTQIEEVPGATNTNSDSSNVNTNMFLVTRTAASGTSTIEGLELAYQNAWHNGLGVLANYTYVNSKGLDAGNGTTLPLEGLSKHSYNLVGFFERDRYALRLAYNWRDEQLVSRSFNGSALFEQGRGQLDMSVSLDLTKNLALNFEIINLTGERVDQFAALEERPFRIENTGRRFFFGVQGSF